MNILIRALGKVGNPAFEQEIERYRKRCRQLTISIQQHKEDLKANDWLFQTPGKGGPLIALSEQGEQFSSGEFSALLFGGLPNSAKGVVFVIGGSSGIPNNYLSRATKVISFGRLTYPHELFRLMLVEQLYRAETIFYNHPYNK